MNIHSFSKRKVLLLLPLLLISIPITIFLTQNNQDLLQDAARMKTHSSAHETHFNVDGRVYIDANSDRLFNEGETPIANAKLLLSDAPNTPILKRKLFYSDSRGFFVLSQLTSKKKYFLESHVGDGYIQIDSQTIEFDYATASKYKNESKFNVRVVKLSDLQSEGILLDQNNNQKIDNSDFELTTLCLKTKVNCSKVKIPDLSGNGTVNSADFNLLLRRYQDAEIIKL